MGEKNWLSEAAEEENEEQTEQGKVEEKNEIEKNKKEKSEVEEIEEKNEPLADQVAAEITAESGEEEILEAPRNSFMRIFDLGIVVHELSHYIGALITESKVYHVTLLDKKGGSLSHRHVSGFKSFIIALMPFFIGNALAFALFTDTIRAFHAGNLAYVVFALWLSVSISLYARPSPHDLRQAWKYTEQMWRGSPLRKLVYLIFLPFVYLALIIMEIRQQVFAGILGSFAWVLLSIIIANFYVSIFG